MDPDRVEASVQKSASLKLNCRGHRCWLSFNIEKTSTDFSGFIVSGNIYFINTYLWCGVRASSTPLNSAHAKSNVTGFCLFPFVVFYHTKETKFKKKISVCTAVLNGKLPAYKLDK